MAIEEKERLIEEKYLEDTINWMNHEIGRVEENKGNLKGRIDSLRRESKGKYNEELETAEKLYKITSKSLEKYSDGKESPYFARIDFREKKRDVESYYIGKFGLGDGNTGEERVIDWRSPIADLYYGGTFGECYYRAPMGLVIGELSLKRKFIIREEKLIDAFDEGINEVILRGNDEEGSALVDEFLKVNLEESGSSKLKEVVATIQKEQNEVIRSEKNIPLILQGVAGSGKTTVALHRVAYLLYKYKEKLLSKDILIIAPNKVFLDYISDVLPNLGVDSIKQNTYEEIVCEILNIKEKIITKDNKLSQILEEENELEELITISRIKGSVEFKALIDIYIEYIEKEDGEKIEDIKVYDYVLFNKEEIKRLFIEDLKKMPINIRKDEIKRYFTLKIEDKIRNILDKVNFYYEYKVARVKNKMEDGEERRKRLIEIYDERDNKRKDIVKMSNVCFNEYFEKWKEVKTENLYIDFLKNIDKFVPKDNLFISEDIIEKILNEIIENSSKGIIDSEDLAPMLYLKFKIEDVPEKFKYKHIVVDEVQDYSEFQMATLKHMVELNSLTLVGDLAQGIYFYKGINNWPQVIHNVFNEEVNFITLNKSYRSTVEIINFASKVLVKGIESAIPVFRHGKDVEVAKFKNNREFSEKLDEIVELVQEEGKNTIAIICKNYNECKKLKTHLNKYSSNKWDVVKDTSKSITNSKIIIPAYMTKGLEFDCSIIYNCNEDNYGDNELDRKILYVALTRALHYEYIFYNGSKSSLI
ncbi:RNA polymerase recycling motor HelD [Clostridium lundense]|uniref:RNA polymerase recycling motor HelD n=1 Tax=Clostridium lundense TaxID=319475 RepID=UPI00047F969F|nr:RNA polymerase recycling motor HelD [Clostridium lundense]